MSQWRDELGTYGGRYGWPGLSIAAAADSIQELPDADDYDPPGPFWKSAAEILGRTIGALPGFDALVTLWAKRAEERGVTSWDEAKNAAEWAAEAAASVVVKTTGAGVILGSVENISGHTDSASANAVKVAEDLKDAANNASNTARMIGLPIVGILAAMYLGFGRRKS